MQVGVNITLEVSSEAEGRRSRLPVHRSRLIFVEESGDNEIIWRKHFIVVSVSDTRPTREKE